MDSFWDFFWFTVSFFLLFAYLMVLFQVVGDLFRDHTVSGWGKAVWIICLIFFPFITLVVYLIARGQGMTERNIAAAQGLKQQQDEYIRSVAGGAKSLLDSGAITQAEFDALKAKALA